MKANKKILTIMCTFMLGLSVSSSYADTNSPVYNSDKPLYLQAKNNKEKEKRKKKYATMYVTKDTLLYKDEGMKDIKGPIIAGQEISVEKGTEVSYSKKYNAYIKNDTISESLNFSDKKGEVSFDTTINLYKKTDITSKVIKKIDKDTKIEIEGNLDRWLKVKIDEKDYGYIFDINRKAKLKDADSNVITIDEKSIDSNTSVEDSDGVKTTETSITDSSYYPGSSDSLSSPSLVGEEELDDTSGLMRATMKSRFGRTVYIDYKTENQKKLIEMALQYEGNRYILGGNSLTNGIDCSGFTKALYARFGYDLPRYSGHQRSVGRSVSRRSMQAGDIICFHGHVGLYMGNGQMIHASSPSTGIIITNIGYGGHSVLTVRRIFE